MSNEIKVLYVDDEPINTKLLEINFRDKFSVITAENGMQALELLNANSDTHVVLSDMKMPLMNGIEFIEKAKEKYPDKKYFILTGFEITGEIKKALDSGLIIKYFRKPLDMKEIELSIKDVAEL